MPGERVSYTVEVTNDGPSLARAVAVRDVLPDGISEITADLGGRPAACTIAGSGVSCPVGDLARGASATVSITGVLDPAYAGSSLANTASVGAVTLDRDPGNNVDTAETPVGPRPAEAADLVLAKTLEGAAVAGAQVVWTIDVRNRGEATATDVRLTDPVPAGVRIPTEVLPAGCSLTAGTVTCGLGDLGSGQTTSVTLTGILDARASGALENTATVSSSATEADPADNTDMASAEIRRVADLAVTKTADDGTVRTGDQVVYVIDVTNVGPSDAPDTRVVEDWPSGVDFRSATVSQGSYDAEAMVWRVGTLVAGTSARLVLHGEVRSQGALENQVGVTAPGIDDTVAANNVATVELRRARGLAETGGPALGTALVGLLLAGAGALLLTRRRWGRPKA